MTKLFVDKTIQIQAPVSKVWDVLTLREYTDLWALFFTGGKPFTIESKWVLGADVLWKDAEGKVEVNGTVTEFELYKILRFTCFDVSNPVQPVLQKEDGITYEFKEMADGGTSLRVLQGDFSGMPDGEKYRDLSAEVWDRVLPVVKRLAEDLEEAKR